MSGPKRTPTERENNLEKIAALYLKGMRQADIAKEIGVDQSQVSRDLKTIHARWRESTLVSINEAKHRELARIDELERTYWTAWAASVGEKTKTRTQKGTIGTGDTAKGTSMALVEKDQMLGNPSFLTGVQWCIERRCKIFGIDAPFKQELTGRDGGPIETRELSKLSDEDLERIASSGSRGTP